MQNVKSKLTINLVLKKRQRKKAAGNCKPKAAKRRQ